MYCQKCGKGEQEIETYCHYYSGNLNKDIVIAVSENDEQKVEELLAKGARVNSIDDDGDIWGDHFSATGGESL